MLTDIRPGYTRDPDDVGDLHTLDFDIGGELRFFFYHRCRYRRKGDTYSTDGALRLLNQLTILPIIIHDDRETWSVARTWTQSAVFAERENFPGSADKVSDNSAILRVQSRSSSTIKRAPTYIHTYIRTSPGQSRPAVGVIE